MFTKDTQETIVAQATPPGRGGIGVVRISGIHVKTIAQQILEQLPEPRRVFYGNFYDINHAIIDQGIALYFQAPHSFTGEDVLELQGHGGRMVMQSLVNAAIQAGARLARPGEFSERAFLNDKIDLAQAEAIADLIDASSIDAARSAIRSLQGEFSQAIHDLVKQLIELRMFIEAAIDFPEEEIDFLSDQRLLVRFNTLTATLANVEKSAQQGAILRDGMKVVIAGRPNAGKSSLLNQLSGYDRAIVTEIPGTTRDILIEQIQIDGMPLHIIDTAGIRVSEDIVEQEGIRRTKNEMNQADRILLLLDDAKNEQSELLISEYQENFKDKEKITFIYNKIDLTNNTPRVDELNGVCKIYLSAKTGEGIDLLREHLKFCMGFHTDQKNTFIARQRHLQALTTAKEYIAQAEQQLLKNKAGELVAEDLRVAQQALCEITGEFSSDDLLGRIFSEFCIGK